MNALMQFRLPQIPEFRTQAHPVHKITEAEYTASVEFSWKGFVLFPNALRFHRVNLTGHVHGRLRQTTVIQNILSQ